MNKKHGTGNQVYRIFNLILAVVLVWGLVLDIHSIAQAKESGNENSEELIVSSDIVDLSEDKLVLEEETKEEPNTAVEIPGDTTPDIDDVATKTKEPNITEGPKASEETNTLDGDVDSEIISLSENTELLAETSTLENKVINVQNYFNATGQSTNKHYIVKGIYIDSSSNVHVLVYRANNDDTDQVRFYGPKINGIEPEHFSYEPSDDDPPFKNATLVLPGGGTIHIGDNEEKYDVFRIIDFNFGQMMDILKEGKEQNRITILNSAEGFSIENAKLTVDMDYSITKSVSKEVATIGDELIYTITVKNDGPFPLSGIRVADTIPRGITILGVSMDMENWENATIEESDIILDTSLGLEPNGSKKYYIKAYVNGDVADGQTIENEATMSGKMFSKKATAKVTIKAIDVTIQKIVTGNFGDVSRDFQFTVNVTKSNEGHYNVTPFEFGLSHDEIKELNNLPTDAVLTLTEESRGHDITVMVGDQEITPSDGKYIIHVNSIENKTITVYNHKTAFIDMGILLDDLPYVLILAFVLVGLGLIVINKRSINSQDQ